MTRDEILNMPAGREIDALIEQYIFHHQVFQKEVVHRTSNTNKRKDATIIVKEAWAILTKYSCVPVRSYSTNIKDAWEVVNKLDDDGYDIDLNNCVAGWKCTIHKSSIYHSARDVNAPIIICRAALLSVMEDK